MDLVFPGRTRWVLVFTYLFATATYTFNKGPSNTLRELGEKEFLRIKGVSAYTYNYDLSIFKFEIKTAIFRKDS